DNWTGLDATDLRLFLNERVGGPGQHNSRSNNADELYLPLAGSACRIVLIFREKKIVSIEPGQAFDVSEWNRVCEDVERSILAGRTSLQPRRSEHFWASIPRDHHRHQKNWFQKIWQSFFWWSRRSRSASGTDDEFRWVQHFFFAKLGQAVIDELSLPAANSLRKWSPKSITRRSVTTEKVCPSRPISTSRFVATRDSPPGIERSLIVPPSGSTWLR